LGLEWFGLDKEPNPGGDAELVTEGALSTYMKPYAEMGMVMLYEERG